MEESDLENPQEMLVSAFEEENLDQARELLPDIHPADVAAAYETLPDSDREDLITLIQDNEEKFSEVLPQLPLPDAVEILRDLTDERLSRVLAEIPDDILVDFLQEMPPTQRGHTFHLLSEERRKEARALLLFPDDSAGGRMTTAFATVLEEMTVRQAIETLRKDADETEVLARIYVVDGEGRILGKVRLRDLTFSPRSVKIAELNDGDTRAVLATSDQEKAVRTMMKYDMLALPVVDEDGRLLGVITHDDALDIQQEETTEDFEKQSGISGYNTDETYLNTPVLYQVRRRVGWIVSLAFLGLISGIVIYSYQNQLNSIFALTIYMPMIVAAGGNTGGQASTMVIRAMSLGEFTPSAVLRVAWKELRIGFLIGCIISVCMVAQVYFLRPDFVKLNGETLPGFALTVGLALLCQITASTLIGAILPIGARAIRVDPAVIASPAITTIVDATGLLIYLNLARHILHLA